MGILLTMAKQKSKEHAEHNEKVCSYLDSSNNFPDWVITTSFYSSLHYLRHRIFPFKVILDKKNPSVKIDTFDEFHSFESSQGRKLGRHERFRCLVEKKCPVEIAACYSKLLDLSFSARYSEYNYDTSFAIDAKAKLKEIKEFCLPSK